MLASLAMDRLGRIGTGLDTTLWSKRTPPPFTFLNPLTCLK